MKRFLSLALLATLLTSQPAPKEQVGPMPNGGFLLNSGWRISPAGRQVPLGNFPMAQAISPDGKYLLVMNAGYTPPSIAALETASMREVSRTPLPDAFLGLTFSSNGKLVYVGGGSRASVYEFSFDAGKLTLARTFEIVAEKDRKNTDFTGDVAITPDGRFLYATGLFNNVIDVMNLQTGRVMGHFPAGRRPYRILFHPDGKSFFVSSWADASVYQYRSVDGEKLNQIRVGSHPTDMVWRAKKPDEEGENIPAARIFVAAANTNNIYVLGVAADGEVRITDTINAGMTPRHPLGMTPTALAMNAAHDRLYAVCSDANAVAVADISEAHGRLLGFVPTGWYPTGIRVLADGRLVILNGRGDRSYPDPKGAGVEYLAKMQIGSASVVEAFDSDALEKYTGTVLTNSPYRDELLDFVETGSGSPVPSEPGGPTPIEHVIYIARENRSYDQVLGDIGKGNSDASLAQFGQSVTPNAHKLAREFVLFDNFYANADVEADGHNWSAGAIANDYVQKLWPNSYGGRRNRYDYEGQEITAFPPAGYLWNNAISANIPIRNYGWWVTNVEKPTPDGRQVATVRDPALARFTNMNYRGFDLQYPDVERIKPFLKDLAQFESLGVMPKLIFLQLGNDHTDNAKAGGLSPASMVADNDYALGLVVEALSKSKFWPSTAIFVLEDNAQDGPDHVDSHRSPAFVISPYTRRRAVDSTMYNTTSMLRTMELIVGLRPMTHFDAAARPMSAAFSKTADTSPVAAEKPGGAH
jgi:DNA-binding beta-propeller fold protein YncE